LGLFDYLPLIEGWDYHLYTIPPNPIVLGTPVQKVKIDKKGWILNAVLFTTDAYGTIIINAQGPGGTIHSMAANPELALTSGFVQYDPVGYLTMYNRPNPLSTAGWYVVALLSPGLSGFPLPITRECTVEQYLAVGSTQTTALLSAQAFVLEIKDEPAFLSSIRRLGLLPYSSTLDKVLAGEGKTEQDISKTLKDILEELKRGR
jgi:hypothetical protein